MERKEDYVLVGCSSEDNKATWKLTCKDKRWIGETPNCSSGNWNASVSAVVFTHANTVPCMHDKTR